MTKEDIIQILLEEGFQYSGPDDHPNGSKYDLYMRSEEKVWLGNAFIEHEFQGLALNWRFENPTKEELLKYIRG